MDSEAEHDDAPIAVVLVTRRQGREYVDAEHKVRTLQELYDLCRHAAPGQLAKVYGFTDLDGSQPDAWRYVTEVQDAGKPADVTGYR